MLVVESTDYVLASKEYQKAIQAQVVKLEAEGDAAQSVRAQTERNGQASRGK